MMRLCLILMIFSLSICNVYAESLGDTFDDGKLNNSNWEWSNEPDTWDVGETREGYLSITGENNRNLWREDTSNFLYQEIADDVFDVETHFMQQWTAESGANSLVVKSPADNNWVTLKFWSRNAEHKGQIQYQTKGNDGQEGLTGNAGFTPEFGATELYFRLAKAGNIYSSWYKTSAESVWLPVGVYEFELTPPLQIGLSVAISSGDGELTVQYEYFRDNINFTDVAAQNKLATTWGSLKYIRN